MSESGGEGGKCVVDPNTTTKAIVSASIASSSSPDDVHNKMLIETTTSTATAAVVVAAATTTTTKDINVHQKDNNSVGGVKKLRRAFSLSARNPFRLSKRNKNASDQQQPAEDLMPSSKQSETSNQHQQQQHPPSVACHTTTDGKKPKEELRLFRRSSIRKFISRIAQQMTSVSIRPKPSTNTATGDRVPPLGASWPPPDQTPGVTGLKNHGNTCFMNAVLQCLSHTDILAEYFVLDQYKADLKRRNKINSRKFGTKGELTEQLALVLKALWMCCNEAEYSTQFKAVVDRYGAQFRSSTQHDAQEFLFWLLDKVHEDLNTASKRKYKSVKNSYGRPDEVIAAETLANHIRCNNSFVQAVFQAQFRSSLTCPRCHKQSNTFDPFHCISVQLPQLAQQAVFVTVLYASQHPKQVKLGLGVAPGACVGTLRDQLQADTRIPIDRIILTEISSQGFGRVFCDSYPVSELELLDTDTTIFCIETTATQGNQQQQSTAKDAKTPESQTNNSLTLICTNLLVPNADAKKQRFGTPFCLQVDRDVSFNELQKRLLKELAPVLRTDVFTYATAPSDMFRIRLQDPSADEDSYMESTVEHPLFTEMIELALSILPPDAGPSHVKLALEWKDADAFFQDTTDPSVEHASVQQMREKCPSSATLSLEQCLEHYTRAETLSTEDAWRCPHCQQYLPVVKTLGLWSLPDILVIHFKRFRQHGDKGSTAAKLTTMVDFPLNGFDMTPHLAKKDEINGSPWKSKGTSSHSNKKGSLTSAPVDNRYDLYAVCYHQGDTLETGHYTAACKNPYDHQWYKFDDQRVSLVSHEAEDGQIVNNEAYILFYQRRKVDLNGGECSGTSSTSSQDHWVSRLAPLAVQQTSTSNSQSSIRPIITAPVIKDEDAIITEEIPIETTKEEVAASSVPAATSITSPESGISLIPENIHDESNKIEVKAEINNSSSTPTVAFPIVEVASTPTASTVSSNMQRIEKTREDEIVDVESLDFAIENAGETTDPIPSIDAEEELVDDEVDGKILSSEIKAMSTKVDLICKKQHEREKADNLIATLSSSMPTQFPSNSLSSSFFFNGAVGNFASNRSSLNFSNSCSKDTLLYIDHHRHHELEELEDHHRHHHGSDAFLGNRSLWISPVTPHKLITVSPKN